MRRCIPFGSDRALYVDIPFAVGLLECNVSSAPISIFNTCPAASRPGVCSFHAEYFTRLGQDVGGSGSRNLPLCGNTPLGDPSRRPSVPTNKRSPKKLGTNSPSGNSITQCLQTPAASTPHNGSFNHESRFVGLICRRPPSVLWL